MLLGLLALPAPPALRAPAPVALGDLGMMGANKTLTYG